MTSMRGGMGRRGFTLIELVVVIGIMALLIAITIVVGAGVMAGARGGKTRDAIKTMQISLTEYISDRSNIPPPTIQEPNPHLPDNQRLLMPVADAVFDIGNKESGLDDPQPRLINSVGLYILQLEDSPGAATQIQSLGEDFLQLRPTYTPTSDSGFEDLGENDDHAGIPTVLDGWGRPLRYVHPRFDGQIGAGGDARRSGRPGTTYALTDILQSLDASELSIQGIRRNKIVKSEYLDVPESDRDADGGQCPSDRPYFYSAGPDGDPSSTEDNVYATEPVFTNPDFDDG